MIKINRTKIPKELSETNKKFKAKIANMTTKEAYNFYNKHRNTYKYNTDETKQEFKKMNHERCSFCTRFIQDFDDEMTVEHIKIKRDYPKLIFQWSNLLCSCRTCNTKRSTSAYNPKQYLDPTKINNIEEYFCFQLDGKIIENKELNDYEREKANYMIKLYDMNRHGLVCKRWAFLKDLMSDDDFYKTLEKMDLASQNIIFLSVFAYYRRCREKYGE